MIEPNNEGAELSQCEMKSFMQWESDMSERVCHMARRLDTDQSSLVGKLTVVAIEARARLRDGHIIRRSLMGLWAGCEIMGRALNSASYLAERDAHREEE